MNRTTLNTDPELIKSLFEAQRANASTVAKSTARDRSKKLKRFQKTILEHKEALREAMWKDFRKPAAEVDLTEIFPVTSEIKHARWNISTWMENERVFTPLALFGAGSWIRFEPKGVCLIISPWNYPMQLAFGPLVSAIAAGNTAIIKPSEHTPHTSKVMKEIITASFDENEVVVVEGGVETATALLELPFNHIFFTGSPEIGKVVMRAAANHLSSVTLELGGKSPTIIDETANVRQAAKRIAWAKFCNNGQICIAPDYILVHESKRDAFVEALKEQLRVHYGEQVETSPDYMRIINNRHFQRVKSYLDNTVAAGGKIAFGGNTIADQNFIEPTIVVDVPMDSDMMKYEIFGPLLPVITYKDKEEVIDIINSKEKPLALYIYSKKRKNIKYFVENTTAGGTSINMSGVHFGNNYLPFGGVNNSGIGKSHGFFGFQEFSNMRGMYKQYLPSAIERMMPPYSKFKEKLINLSIKWF